MSETVDQNQNTREPMTPEKIAELKAMMAREKSEFLASADEEISYLEKQLKFNTLLGDLDEQELRRIKIDIMRANLLNPPQQQNQNPTPPFTGATS